MYGVCFYCPMVNNYSTFVYHPFLIVQIYAMLNE